MSQKRESKYVRFARLAYVAAQASVARYAHPKSTQRFTQPQILVCLLLTQYLNLSYRNTEEWLLASAEVRAILELSEVPNRTTIARMFNRVTLPRLEALLAQVLNQLEGNEDAVALDATGFTSPKPEPTTRPAAGENTGTGERGLCGGHGVPDGPGVGQRPQCRP